MLSVLDMSTASMKTTFDIDCMIYGEGGLFSSYSLKVFSISVFSPRTYAPPFMLICAIDGL